jgi:hypothetical protein
MKTQTLEKRIDLATADGVAELEAYLQCRLCGRVRDFRLVVLDRGVLLRGHALTYYAKQLAQHAVMQATDLPIQANEIEVS